MTSSADMPWPTRPPAGRTRRLGDADAVASITLALASKWSQSSWCALAERGMLLSTLDAVSLLRRLLALVGMGSHARE